MNNVISTSVVVFRNLKDYKFVAKLEPEKKLEIVEKLTDILKGKFEYINLSKVDDKTLEKLQAANIEYNSQHLYINKDKTVAISLFVDEHLSIRSRVVGYDTSVYKTVTSLIKLLNDKVNLAYSDEYGYLMSDISRVGPGMHITSEVCLPNLKNINKIEQVMNNLMKLRYKLTAVDGDTFLLQTTCNLGFSESEVIADFEKMLKKLCDLEVESAKMIHAERPDELIDQVSRCIAILSSAHLMSPRELRGHISTLRTAKNLELSKISTTDIDRLQALTSCRNEEFVSRDDLIKIASKTKEIMKGVQDV